MAGGVALRRRDLHPRPPRPFLCPHRPAHEHCGHRDHWTDRGERARGNWLGRPALGLLHCRPLQLPGDGGDPTGERRKCQEGRRLGQQDHLRRVVARAVDRDGALRPQVRWRALVLGERFHQLSRGCGQRHEIPRLQNLLCARHSGSACLHRGSPGPEGHEDDFVGYCGCQRAELCAGLPLHLRVWVGRRGGGHLLRDFHHPLLRAPAVRSGQEGRAPAGGPGPTAVARRGSPCAGRGHRPFVKVRGHHVHRGAGVAGDRVARSGLPRRP
mmetsp:Transcript_8912/g.30628  ORF Transcript_8912/g.30628 Transcript_8912/m.30628 type:complete len:270 (+) Transcript_8912:481-1290(+)